MIRIYSLVILIALTSVAHANNIIKFQGKAYDTETNQHIYTEKHQVTVNQKGQYLKSFVEYIDPEDVIFATKDVSYLKSRLAPSFTFSDLRTDSTITVEPNIQTISLTSEEGTLDSVEMVLMDTTQDVVVDSGFDRFIYNNWTSLLETKKLSFPFLAINRALLVDLQVTEKSRSASRVVYEVEPTNFFFRLIVDPIELTYNLDTKRLLRFKGVTNILNTNENDNYIAVIEYQYFE